MKNKLHEKFDDFGSIPNPEVWTEIERKLNQDKNKKRIIFWFTSGIAALLIGSVFLLFPNNNEQTNTSKLAKKEQKKVQKLTSNSTSKTKYNSQNNTKEISSTINSTKKIKGNKHNYLRSSNLKDEKIELKKNDLSQENKTVEKDSLNLNQVLVENKSIENDSVKEEVKVKKDSVETSQNTKTLKKDSTQRKNKWSLEFSLATWDAKNNMNQIDTNPNEIFNNDQSSNNNFAINTSGNYKMSLLKPYSIYLKINYQSAKNWIISSGINADALISKTENNTTKTVTRSHSIGIPLGIGYKFFPNNDWSFVPKLTDNNDFLSNSVINSSVQKDYSLINSLNYQNSAQLDLALFMNVSKRSSISITPSFRYYIIQNLNFGPLLNRRFWYGIQLGYVLNF